MFYVVFEPMGDGEHGAVINIPPQGVEDWPLTEVEYTADKLKFTMPQVGAVFQADRDGSKASGTFKQRGLTIPFELAKTTADAVRSAGPQRPQTPAPPFPYTQREVTYENPVDGTKLAGTLTIPQGAGPHPAVIFITGSGPQDRDETIFGHKPFAVIADHLTRHGIATLRVDDRGVGGSTGSIEDSTTKDFANDVLSGIRFLKKQGEIDVERLGLIGHSEGGLIAPLVASRSKSVDCIVLLAGPALPGHEILNLQMRRISEISGASADWVQKQSRIQRELLDVVLNNGSDDDLRAAVGKLIELQLAANLGAGMTDEIVEAMVDATMKQLRSTWMQFFIKHDPRPTLQQVKCPVLALFGEKDLQVPPDENVPEMRKALAGNNEVTVKELPKLNHLFQEATTGMLPEYYTIEQTVSPEALDVISSWLKEQFGLRQRLRRVAAD